MKLAIFDFDGTLIPGDSIVRYIRFAVKERYASPAQLAGAGLAAAGYKLGLLDEARAKEISLRFLLKLPEKEKDALDRDFAERCLRPLLRKKGLEEIEKRKAEGYSVWILSASTRNYMQYMLSPLSADRLICTEMKDGAVLSNCKGPEKLRRLGETLKKEGLRCDLRECVAYGDSKSDLPLLKAVGKAYLVDPKRSLRRRAKGPELLSW